MNEEAFQFEIATLTLKPGDVLVVRTLRGSPTMEQAARIKAWIQELLARAGHPETEVLVLGKDVALEILEHAAPVIIDIDEPELFSITP